MILKNLFGAACALVFVATGSAHAATKEAVASELALIGVTVIDATGAPAKPDQTVVISDGKITAIGGYKQVHVPSGARKVNARGKYLIPGLWDLHVHVEQAEGVLPVFVANGVMGIRELSTPMEKIERMRAAGRSGALVTPRIIASGRMIEAGAVKELIQKAAPPAMAERIVQSRYFVNTADEARAAVREAASAHPDWIKQHVNLKREVYFAVLDEAHRLGLPVAGHYPMGERITLREVAEAGQRSIEHLKNGEATDFAKLSDAQRAALVACLKERGVTFVPTLVATLADTKFSEEPTAAARVERARKDPRARFIPPSMWKLWQDMLSVSESVTKPKDKQAVVIPKSDEEAERRLLREMHAGGVPVLAGTDFTVQFLFPGSSLHEELIELVKEIGMTPYEALQSATRGSAELVGQQESLGTAEVGKTADLVVLAADPITDIANTQQISAVVQGGRYYDRHALDALLEQAAHKIQGE